MYTDYQLSVVIGGRSHDNHDVIITYFIILSYTSLCFLRHDCNVRCEQ